MGTALETAMKGGKVPDTKAKGALSQAVDKIASLTRRADRTKEAVAETGALVVHTAETQGSLFLASLAEGYFGADKLKLGGVDLRAPAAILAQGYGLYESISGKGGEHALSLGNGIMGSWLASVAVSAGRTLADKAGKPAAAPAAGPAIRGEIGAPIREVLLTPEPTTRGDEEERRRPLHARPRPDNRFARARAA
ncbi:hypothetical protein L6R50_09175 [Myxococcota bacterium]|nr:hypothetical protein [Myxococcota bacterium]